MKKKTKSNLAIIIPIILVIAMFGIIWINYTPRKIKISEQDLEKFEDKEDLEEFLTRDGTDLHQYGSAIFESVTRQNTWNCVDYANKMRVNALEEGYDLDIIIMNFENIGHAINRTETKNGKIYYIEPQTD